MNRQGPDVGTQYRSVIFYNSNEEKKIAEIKIKEINDSGEYDREVATDLKESVEFYEAEEYHQDFVKKNGKICYHAVVVRGRVLDYKRFFENGTVIFKKRKRRDGKKCGIREIY